MNQQKVLFQHPAKQQEKDPSRSDFDLSCRRLGHQSVACLHVRLLHGVRYAYVRVELANLTCKTFHFVGCATFDNRLKKTFSFLTLSTLQNVAEGNQPIRKFSFKGVFRHERHITCGLRRFIAGGRLAGRLIRSCYRHNLIKVDPFVSFKTKFFQ